MLDLDLGHIPAPPVKKDFAIGVIGAGFIVKDIQLVAYRQAGYNVQAIASDVPENSRAVAAAHGIPKVYDTPADLLADKSIEILDIAVPPHAQLAILKDAVSHSGHLKGILAQKPLAMNYREAKQAAEMCSKAGIALAVNQNMRYDQSIRALKTVLDRGYLGEPVLATIEMRAIPHWQAWIREYGRLTMLVMSIHHLDTFRYLFGDPESVYVSARPDPRTAFPHRDGIVLYILEYANGLRAAAWDDVWTGPAREGAAPDNYIRWRVEGMDGMAQGTIGWPSYPNAEPSTIDFTTKLQPQCWFSPRWKEVWFPGAFAGTMGQLLQAVSDGAEPAIGARDNLHTMALVDACYKSLEEHRPVRITEILEES
ncbi:MAG: Gfo/Idh/MocA family oxidoreductase [Bryobacteraceae bacterium]|nr:Gfo/Idh/MocA family oxidoreductase [Bryobacterales bacterium]MEB2360915.1 Gfo/Idh/MocA family oxidoreductase [Bryobacterales bacterium]NUN00340.1 Gfo/Idh/MocA family oxidoreductase [Bryobacteraceae bacterium]